MSLKLDDTPWLAIVNPASGRQGSRRQWPAIERAIRIAGVAVEAVHTVRPGEGESLARRAVVEGRRQLLVAGGDGSAHEVVNGVMSAGLADTRTVTLAVAPTGTGNDWARSLGVGRRAADIAAVLAAGRTMLHDVGVIEHPGATPPQRRHFINVAGAGYDAWVTSRVPRPVPSALTYLRIALGGLASFRSPLFRIRSGEAALDGRLLLAFVAIGQYCGNRMHVAPRARPDDGRFDVVAIREVGLLTALGKLAKLYRGTLAGDRLVHEVQCTRLRIETDPPAAVEADGQVVGRTPVTVSLLPNALRVLRGPGPAADA